MNYGMTQQQRDPKDTLSAFSVIRDTFFTPDGLRLASKRGRGRPKIVGPPPWETEGISRQAWYKRQSKINLK